MSAEATSPEPTALSGHVVDAGGQPLAEASISVIPLTSDSSPVHLKTNKEGTFAVQLLAEGLYSVEASSQGFLNVRYQPVAVIFPRETELMFVLPVGEISEGGIQVDAILSGTLVKKGKPAAASRICASKIGSNIEPVCTDTNELGQYAMSVSPGIYTYLITQNRKQLVRRKLDLSRPAIYRNLIKLD